MLEAIRFNSKPNSSSGKCFPHF